MLKYKEYSNMAKFRERNGYDSDDEYESEQSEGEQSEDSNDYEEELSTPLPSLERLKISDQNHIKFVLNVPTYVPLRNMDEFSSDTSDDGTFSVEAFDFDITKKDSFPFRTFGITNTVTESRHTKSPKKKTHKQVLDKKLGSSPLKDRDEGFDLSKATEDFSKSHELLDLLSEGAFDEDHKDYIDNLGVSIGLNRPHSLSTRKNNCLIKELHRKEETEVQYKKTAFFWEMPWVNSTNMPQEYSTVRKFYKQLKRKDPAKAAEFLKVNEEDAETKPSVPYQHIREHLKNHKNTKALVEALKAAGSVVYFSSIDSDTQDFNHIYSAYLNIIAKSRNPPTVMSTGYEFDEEEDGYPLHVGSKLERIIRIVTEETLTGCVYYPEPNFCVVFPAGSNTLPYSFIDRKVKTGTFESPILLRQILQSAECILVFSDENPIITSGDRAKKRLETDKVKFSDIFENGGPPTQEDLAKLSLIIQSTAAPRDWAEGVYYNKCFDIKGSAGASGAFKGYITKLFKGEDISRALQELRKIVKPSSMVDTLYQAVKNVKYTKEKFSKPFEEDKLLDLDPKAFLEILAQFYILPSIDILTIIRLSDGGELYNALNSNYSLYQICRMYQVNYGEKFYAIFSQKSRDIHESTEGVFEDITYEDLEDLYDKIIKKGGSTEDFEELLHDEEGLFGGKYGDLEFDEIVTCFLSYLSFVQENYDDGFDESMSAYDMTTRDFVQDFEDEYKSSDTEEEEEYGWHHNNGAEESLLYPEGSYEDFQQKIQCYGDRFGRHAHFQGTNFILAARLGNVSATYRDDILKKLPGFIEVKHAEKESIYEKGKIDSSVIECLDNLRIFPQICSSIMRGFSSAQHSAIESIRDINQEISAALDLQGLLLSSLDTFPSHENNMLGQTGTDYSDYAF